MRKLILITIFSFIVVEISAQSFFSRRANRRWIASAGVGYARSLGDLTNPGTYFDTKLNTELGLSFRATDRIHIRTGLLYFQLSGDDADLDPELGTQQRNLSFVSDNVELHAGITVSLFPMPTRFTQRRLINPYGFVGIGGLFFNPKAEVPEQGYDGRDDTFYDVPNAGEMVALYKYDTERPNDYSRFALVIPVGIGVKVKAADFLDISVEMANRITFTDYLDDVSGRRYPDISQFDLSTPEDQTAWALANPTGEPGVRGNPDSDDYYLIFNVKADFYIQGDFFNKLFGIGGKRFNIRPRGGRGMFIKKARRR